MNSSSSSLRWSPSPAGEGQRAEQPVLGQQRVASVGLDAEALDQLRLGSSELLNVRRHDGPMLQGDGAAEIRLAELQTGDLSAASSSGCRRTIHAKASPASFTMKLK